MNEYYKGFCFDKSGWHTPEVVLMDVPEIINYCALQSIFFHEIRITDHYAEDTVFQVIDGIIQWPEEAKGKPIKELQQEMRAKDQLIRQSEEYQEYLKSPFDPRD
jgi:hypothetical protein